MKLRMQSVGFDADQKLQDFINEKFEKLEQYYDRIIDSQVFLKLENTGQVKDKIVELKVIVPGDTLFVSESSKTFETATDRVVDNMTRQLIRHKSKYGRRPS